MKKEFYKEIQQFSHFIKRNKILLLFIMTLTYFTYATKIVLYDYSVDTEQFMAQSNDVLRWWLRIGRYGLVLLKQVTMFGDSMNVTMINLITYTLLGINSYFLCYLIWRLNSSFFQSKMKFFFLSASLFISSPVIIEQTNFILQSVEVMLSILCVFLSILFIQLYMESRVKTFFLLSCVFAWFAFSVYPSLIIAFILVAIMSILFSITNKNQSFITYFKKSIPYMLVCFISLFVYLIVEKIILLVFYLKASSYLADESGVGKIPLDKLIERSIEDFFTYFIRPQTFFMCVMTFLLVIVLILLCSNKSSWSYKSWCILSLLSSFLFVISPLWVLGRIGPIRALVPAVPIVLFFYSLLLYCLIDKMKVPRYTITVLSLIVIGGQIKTTSDLGLTEYRLFQQEQTLMNNIVTELQTTYDIQDFSKYKLAVIGKKEFDLNTSVTGDVIGKSFFNWNYGHRGGCSKKVANFFYSQGVPIKYVSPPEYKELLQYKDQMTSFPQANSIEIRGNIILIKL